MRKRKGDRAFEKERKRKKKRRMGGRLGRAMETSYKERDIERENAWQRGEE